MDGTPPEDEQRQRRDWFQATIDELHERHADLHDGRPRGTSRSWRPSIRTGSRSRPSPSTARTWESATCEHRFTIQSISKLLMYGLALETHGRDAVLERVGVAPTGESFNAIALDDEGNRAPNPMVNAGAIAVTDLVAGADVDERVEVVRSMYERYLGRRPEVDPDVWSSERATGNRNRAIAYLMLSRGIIGDRVEETLDLYFGQCSVLVTADELATIGATLANFGVHPRTGEQVVAPRGGARHVDRRAHLRHVRLRRRVGVLGGHPGQERCRRRASWACCRAWVGWRCSRPGWTNTATACVGCVCSKSSRSASTCTCSTRIDPGFQPDGQDRELLTGARRPARPRLTTNRGRPAACDESPSSAGYDASTRPSHQRRPLRRRLTTNRGLCRVAARPGGTGGPTPVPLAHQVTQPVAMATAGRLRPEPCPVPATTLPAHAPLGALVAQHVADGLRRVRTADHQTQALQPVAKLRDGARPLLGQHREQREAQVLPPQVVRLQPTALGMWISCGHSPILTESTGPRQRVPVARPIRRILPCAPTDSARFVTSRRQPTPHTHHRPVTAITPIRHKPAPPDTSDRYPSVGQRIRHERARHRESDCSRPSVDEGDCSGCRRRRRLGGPTTNSGDPRRSDHVNHEPAENDTPPDPGQPLTGKVIAVIGASGALGSLVARRLSDLGAQLVLAGPSSERLHAAQLEGATVVQLDVRDPRAGDLLCDAALERHGRLDGVVNAAGVVAFGALVDTDDVVIEELFLTNVIGPLWLAKRVAPLLAESKGFLVQLSAVVAEQPQANMAAYSASKAALSAADAALTREFRRLGIRVCDVRPPHTETGLAGRPLSGAAPKLPEGLAPDFVADTDHRGDPARQHRAERRQLQLRIVTSRWAATSRSDPSVVWDLLVDTDRWSQWGPSVAAVELTGAEPDGTERGGRAPGWPGRSAGSRQPARRVGCAARRSACGCRSS